MDGGREEGVETGREGGRREGEGVSPQTDYWNVVLISRLIITIISKTPN